MVPMTRMNANNNAAVKRSNADLVSQPFQTMVRSKNRRTSCISDGLIFHCIEGKLATSAAATDTNTSVITVFRSTGLTLILELTPVMTPAPAKMKPAKVKLVKMNATLSLMR